MKDIKIEHDELKRLYEAFVFENTISIREHCPSPEQIVLLFSRNLQIHKKYELINHVTQCSYCMTELRFMLEALSERDKFANEIESLIYRDKKQSKKNWIFGILRFRHSWAFVTAVMATAILLSIYFIRSPKKQTYRSNHFDHIELISPVNKIFSKTQILFEWKGPDAAEFFILEIFDDSLSPVWKSEKIMKTWFEFSRKNSSIFSYQKKYFWMVTAYFAEGKSAESQLEEFILSK